MRLRRILSNAVTPFVLLVVTGCSGGSGTTSDDADSGDSSVVSDHVSSESEDGSFETADAEAPPVAPPHCGDGVLDPEEECDDGNRLDGDGCDWLCRLGLGEPVDSTPDPSVGDLQRDLSWTPVVPSLPEGATISPQSLRLVWTGSAYATVWNVSSVDPDGVRWEDAQFHLFDRLGHPIVPDWTYHYPDRGFGSLDLAWSGRLFGLVWCTGRGEDRDYVLSAMILDAVGKPLVGPFTLVEDPGGCPATVSWDGEAFAAVWNSDQGGGIGITRFDELGSIVVVVPGVYEPTGTGLTAWSASSSAATVTVFREYPPGRPEQGRLRWIVTGADGRPLRPPAELGPIGGAPAAIGWGGHHFAIVFDDGTEDTGGFQLALLDANGFLLGPTRPVLHVHARWSVALAWGAGGWAIAYDDYLHLGIHLLRTDATGTLIGAEDTADPGMEPTGYLAMAFDGEGFGILLDVPGGPEGLLFTRYIVVP